MAVDIILLSIFGGMASILTPCNLFMLPSFIGLMTIKSKNKQDSAKYTLFYGVGYIIIYVSVGLSLLFVSGFILQQYYIKFLGEILLILIGIRLMLFGTRKLFTKKEDYVNRSVEGDNKDEKEIPNHETTSNKKSFFILGISHGTAGFACASALFSSVIIAILTLDSVFYGAILLLLYCIGLISVLFVLAVIIGQINQLLILKIRKYMSKIERILGLIIIIFGIINLSSTINILW